MVLWPTAELTGANVKRPSKAPPLKRELHLRPVAYVTYTVSSLSILLVNARFFESRTDCSSATPGGLRCAASQDATRSHLPRRQSRLHTGRMSAPSLL